MKKIIITTLVLAAATVTFLKANNKGVNNSSLDLEDVELKANAGCEIVLELRDATLYINCVGDDTKCFEYKEGGDGTTEKTYTCYGRQ